GVGAERKISLMPGEFQACCVSRRWHVAGRGRQIGRRRPGISCFPPEVGGVAADGSIHNGSVRRRNGVLPDARFGVPARRGFHRGFCLDYLVISPSPFRETKAKLLMESALSIARVLKRRKRNSFVSPACISVKNFCKDALDKVIMTP